MFKYLILYCALLITNTFLVAQSIEQFSFQQYTTENGLPSNGIKGLEWDEQTNFLWMATEAGIVRFNGVDFRTFTKENMRAIASERLLFMIKNSSGKIYVSDQPGNVFTIEQNKPVLWHKTAVNDINNPHLVNYFLLQVSDKFFNTYSGSTLPWPESIGHDILLYLNDTSFLLLKKGNLSFNTLQNAKSVALSFIREPVTTVFKINEKVFIANEENKVFQIDREKQTMTAVLIKTPNGLPLRRRDETSQIHYQTGMAKPIYIDSDKAYELTYENNAIAARFICSGIPVGSYIRSVRYSEKNKLLFIATESKGLIVINQNRVSSKKRNDLDSKNRNQYYAQVELENGNVLTNEGDIIGDKPTSSTDIPIKGKFSYNVVTTSDSLLWFNQRNPDLGYAALHQYNKNSDKTKLFEKIRWGDFVAASDNKIYLANINGIGILIADTFSMLYKYPKNLQDLTTFDFSEIAPGMLGIASCAGLLRYNTATNQLDIIFSQENMCIRKIWKYKDYIFLGSYGSGYFIYKNGRIMAMPLDKNKFLLYTHCFVEDKDGYCWISTNRGLFKASINELLNVFEKKSTSAYYHYFGKKDGMDMTELNGGCTPCALTLRDKTISFPTMDGLLWVNPETASPILPSGEIYIDDVIIDNDNKDVAYLSDQQLPSGTKDITLALAFSAWSNKENIYLEYQMNDSLVWKPVNFENDAVLKFTNLSYGSYDLKIRKRNGFGINNYSYKDISFTIITPWHKRWWFYVLIGFGTFGLFGLYFRVKTRQQRIRQQKLEFQVAEKTKELQSKNEVLEKNNSIKTRLISIISHDIITPLKFVTVAGQNLIAKRSVMSEELQQETIKEITNTSQELHLLSTNILNWIKYQNENRRIAKENFNLSEVIDQVFGILNSLSRQKNLTLRNSVAVDIVIYQYREPLKILVYNLLTNAINFSERGRIEVAATSFDNELLLEVIDEGVGMTPEQIKNILADQFIISSANIDNRKGNGLGYLIIKDLVKMMDAGISIQSAKGSGTRVSIQLTSVR